jgi:hypothetical protein
MPTIQYNKATLGRSPPALATFFLPSVALFCFEPFKIAPHEKDHSFGYYSPVFYIDRQ